jgi:hypothetical protein
MASQPQAGPQVLFAILIVTIAVLWYRHSSTPEAKPAVATVAPVAPAPAADPTPPPPANETSVAAPAVGTPSAPSAAQSGEEFQDEFSKCFPDRSPPNSLSDFVTAELNSANMEERETTLENIQINDGTKEQRLNILPRGENAEVKIFTVDEHGMPIPTGRSQWMTADAADTLKQDFLHRGRVTLQERKDAVLFRDGMRAEVEWENDDVHSAIFVKGNNSLQCSGDKCECQDGTRELKE